MINESEQWKLNGQCGKCRRANYCKQDCTALKRRRQNIIRKACADFLAERLIKPVEEE